MIIDRQNVRGKVQWLEEEGASLVVLPLMIYEVLGPAVGSCR